MKTILIILSAVALLGCPSPDPTQLFHHFIADFPFSEQGISLGDPPFAVDRIRLGLKQYRAIVQNGPGRISFYIRLEEEPVLAYRLYGSRQTIDKADARILIESDFPDPYRREHLVQSAQAGRIELLDFQRRSVRISFLANHKLSGPMFWVDPVIEQKRVNGLDQPTIEAVRSLQDRRRKDNLLIILLDAARPAHFGCYGYSKPTTPIIDGIAQQGIVFEKAFTQAVYTIASTGSLFTGLQPDVHQVLYRKNKLPAQFKTMAEYFREAGFRTDMFSANGFGGPNFGYDQGFHKVWKLWYNPSMADAFLPAVTSWLKEIRNQRFFAYLHFREPHEPYRPPAPYLARFQTDLSFEPMKPPRPWTDEEKKKMLAAYDANLNYVDEQVGKILEYMRSIGVLDRTVIFVISDHGESFWEHGARGHDTQVYDEMIRIPFIVRVPNEPNLRGLRKSQPVGTIDILPTVMQLFGLSQRGAHYDGKSVLPLMINDVMGNDRLMLARTNFEQPAYSLRSTNLKYIYHVKPFPEELYFLDSDPAEKSNEASKFPILATTFRTELQKRLKQMERSRKTLQVRTEQAIIDAETRESLEALGYVNE